MVSIKVDLDVPTESDHGLSQENKDKLVKETKEEEKKQQQAELAEINEKEKREQQKLLEHREKASMPADINDQFVKRTYTNVFKKVEEQDFDEYK